MYLSLRVAVAVYVLPSELHEASENVTKSAPLQWISVFAKPLAVPVHSCPSTLMVYDMSSTRENVHALPGFEEPPADHKPIEVVPPDVETQLA